jgi:hypothetical protein
MAVALVLSFKDRTRADYDAVNAKLDFDTKTAAGEWPTGLLSHAAGTREDGNLCVIEIWESREAQGRFMQDQLGPALAAAGVTTVPDVTWVDLVNYTVPAGAAAGR